MLMKLTDLLRRLKSLFIAFLIAIFGDWSWQQPNWLIRLRSGIGKLYQTGKAKSLVSLGIFVLLCGMATASWYGYQWWQNRPQPVRIDFAVTEPERTAIENEEKPHPLVISFNASVAPLDQAGKSISQGIQMQPEIVGEWFWVDDKTLQFTPANDWPISQTHNVILANTLTAEQVLLARQKFAFATPIFTAELTKAEFFQDVVDPALKKAIFQLHFSHPVDATELEKHIKLTLTNAASNTKEIKPLTFTVTYDKFKLNAYIHSQALAVPQDNQIAELTIDDGLKANNSEATYEQPLSANVTVPGRFYGLSINDAQITVAPDLKTQSQDQVLLISTTLPVNEKAMTKAVKAWLLPEYPPNQEGIDTTQPYSWSQSEITEDVLALSTPVEMQALPTENEYSQLHSFKIHADVKRSLWLSVDKGLESFGGYQLADNFFQPMLVPEYPKDLQIMGQGSLLSLSGEKKIGLMLRDIAGVKVELGRVLPDQIQHLISQTNGDFGKPKFQDRFNLDNLSERFIQELPFPDLEKGKAHYQAIDLNPYFIDASGQNKRGIFLVNVSNYQPAEQKPATTENTEADDPDNAPDSNETQVEDQRLVVITDLGIIAKTELNGSQVVFVQSIQTGQPQVGANVAVIAKNGLTLMHGTTDADGKVRFAKLSDLDRDREPVLYLVRHQSDMSFLPLNRNDRELDFSRFEVSGAENAEDTNQLDAYLFSDRGIYRPGDTVHIGMIVKTSGWNTPLTGLPLEAEILDPRGLPAKREKLNLATGGFNELTYTSLESSTTGTYIVNLFTVKDNKSDQLLGTTKVKIEEFQPDRMKVAVKFSKPATEGWLHPNDLQALVNVQNLYGAPAEARKVTAELSLQPALPGFKRYRDYNFYDPHTAKQSYTETLTAIATDSTGNAAFPLGLEKYQGATYQLSLTSQAFEAEGGRSVAAETSVLVSDLPYLVGYKADGALNFVAKDAERNLHFIAIDPQLNKTPTDKLTLELLERKVLSVLTKQSDSTYRYESRTKEISLVKTNFTIPQAGFNLRVNSASPGDYSYVLHNAAGLQLARIDYTVAGQGNVSRSLDRNAELQLSLDKTEYALGDKITVNIRAPYTGAGLITIERDKVYASTWFKADTQATVQSIEVPKALMGNGYISVQYMRDPGSDEIFMSPLSYGVVPFKVSLAQHQQPLTLTVPEHLKPGDTLDMKLRSPEPARVVVFAVDEGILQVARYKNPDPLNYFFQKRQLDVDTTQILDLILPEFKKLMQLSAPGGDGEEEEEPASSLLNPFKRKHDKPAVYWSGIIDLNEETVMHYQVPSTFNGSMRVFAVAVTDNRIATAVQQTQVRDDLIITPNTPFLAAPGDEFTVSVALANNVKDSGDKAAVSLKLTTPPQLQIQDEADKTVTIAEGHEGVASFRIKTQDAQKVSLGNATLNFVASTAGHTSHMQTDLSIRPAIPRMTSLRMGNFKSQQDIIIDRKLFSQQRKVSAGISPLPLVAVTGLTDYLENFNHSCTEQLVSKAIPALVLSKYPEFTTEIAHFSEADWLNLLTILRSRQNAEGGFGLWGATPQANEFASVYALHMLMEALANGRAIPDDMLQKTLKYGQTLAASPNNTLEGLRIRAYAAYLLTRQGIVTTTTLASIREALHNNFQDKDWQSDLAAVYLAASYQLLQQRDAAAALLKLPLKNIGLSQDNYQYQNYYDPMIRDAQTLYLLAKHFPDELKKLSPNFLQNIAKALQNNHFNTLSSAYFLMTYQAYSDAMPLEVAKQLAITAIDSNGKQQPLTLPASIAPRTTFAEATQSLHFKGSSNLPLYYAVSESGFDQQLPTQASKQGLEIQRTYLDKQGKPVDKVSLGDEITVQLRMRAIDREWLDNIAIQDLLPAGFEVVLQTTANSTSSSGNESLAEENSNSVSQDRLSTGGNWHSDYVDIREDRVLLYGTLDKNMAEYSYRIKANTSGIFTVPPIYAQSMYEPTIKAYSNAGLMRVE